MELHRDLVYDHFFLNFINDLALPWKGQEKATHAMFVDGAASHNVLDLQKLLIEDIQSLGDWLQIKKVTLKVPRTEFTAIGSRADMQELKQNVGLTIQGQSIYRSPYLKTLSFVVDKTLDWDDHINTAVTKAKNGIAV